MDLRSMLNPVSDASAQAQALNLKTPNRTHSLAAYPPQSPSTPIYPSLPRTASLPISQYRETSVSVSPKTMPPPAPIPISTPSPTMSRKRSLSSISDHQQTPQPPAKRMRTPQPPSEKICTPQSATNSSASENRQAPQPASKPRRYAEPPIWARREADGFVPAPKRANATPQPVVPSPIQHSAPAPAPAAPPQIRKSNLEPSLDNHEPYSDMSRIVANWLWDHVIGTPDYGEETHIEIEAKIGQLQNSDMRIAIPIASEAVMAPGGQRTQFKSMMSMAQHRRLNDYLNHVVREAQLPGRAPMKYKHSRETDKFYDLPTHFLPNLHPEVRAAHEKGGKSPRVRVTRDDKTNQITATIIKLRLADLEVYCPNDDFDFRISVSLETAYPHPIEHLKEHLERGISQARGKDRLSYTHQGFQVDLTQVTLVSNPKEKVHELEIELEADRLREEAMKIQRGIANDYEALVKCFLDNIRVVNRAARAPPAMS